VRQPSLSTLNLLHREREMHSVITSMRDASQRMLIIAGPAGVGRTAVLQKAVSHCKERKWFLAGIVLVKGGK
jgi:Cdc6-like AAA superfamily ATPase